MLANWQVNLPRAPLRPLPRECDAWQVASKAPMRPLPRECDACRSASIAFLAAGADERSVQTPTRRASPLPRSPSDASPTRAETPPPPRATTFTSRTARAPRWSCSSIPPARPRTTPYAHGIRLRPEAYVAHPPPGEAASSLLAPPPSQSLEAYVRFNAAMECGCSRHQSQSSMKRLSSAACSSTHVHALDEGASARRPSSIAFRASASTIGRSSVSRRR